MTDWLPMILLIVSVFLLILTIFLYFYYGDNTITLILFIIGILLGIIACCILIYQRSPSTYQRTLQCKI